MILSKRTLAASGFIFSATAVLLAGWLTWDRLSAQQSTAEPRLWKDSTGQFQVEATFDGIAGDQVRLKRADGTVSQVPLARLSTADQAYVKNLAAVLAPAATSGTAATGGGWTRFLGPNGDGTSTETGLLTSFPGSGPEILWRAPLGSGFSGLTVGGGRVYTQYGRDGREWAACFDAKDGKELWKIENGADFSEGRSFGPRATPCLDGDRVFFVGGHGKLSCVDATQGKEIWGYNLLEKFSLRAHEEGLSPSPQIDGDRLIVVGGNSIFALNKSNGEQVWRALDEKMGHSTPRFATIDGKRQLLALSITNLVGLDPADGKELWRIAQNGVNVATPVVGPGDQVFTAAAYGFGSLLTKVSGGKAEQVYQNNCLATHTATAILHQGHLYGFHDRIGTVRCVDFATGEEKWETRGPGKGNMILAEGQIIILTEDGRLVLAPASPEGYNATAEVRVLEGRSGISFTMPTLLDGKLYLRNSEEMVCVNLKK